MEKHKNRCDVIKSISFSKFEREVISILCWGSFFKVLYEKKSVQNIGN